MSAPTPNPPTTPNHLIIPNPHIIPNLRTIPNHLIIPNPRITRKVTTRGITRDRRFRKECMSLKSSSFILIL